jgi:hypothetical protein
MRTDACCRHDVDGILDGKACTEALYPTSSLT